MKDELELQCAACGCREWRVVRPAELTAAQLLAMAQERLAEEAAQAMAPSRPVAPLPVVIEQQAMASDVPVQNEMASVGEVLETALAADQLMAAKWPIAKWAMPNRWIPWASRVPGARCEVCGQGIGLGDQVRWLMKERAPQGEGLTMHADCWAAAQRVDG